jgi:hypothetical protein
MKLSARSSVETVKHANPIKSLPQLSVPIDIDRGITGFGWP